MRTLTTLPRVTVHLGKFLTKPVRMPLTQPLPSGARTVEVLKTEEKGSDETLRLTCWSTPSVVMPSCLGCLYAAGNPGLGGKA